jgi:hypothetical protein
MQMCLRKVEEMPRDVTLTPELMHTTWDGAQRVEVELKARHVGPLMKPSPPPPAVEYPLGSSRTTPPGDRHPACALVGSLVTPRRSIVCRTLASIVVCLPWVRR